MESFIQMSTGIQGFFVHNPIIMVALVLWTIVWKGFALWSAARLSHKYWFIIILVANTVGILDIIYIYFVAKKYTVVEEDEKE